VSGDRVIRCATAAVVCAVAAVAAVVSYSHIYGLGRAHGQDGTAARLLPVSVDGLILAASLVLLHEARDGRDAPRLARFMLWLGIAATIGANIAYGAGYGLVGALISAWPAVAFIGSVEIAMQQVRRARVAVRPSSARPCRRCRAMWSRRSAPRTRRRSRTTRGRWLLYVPAWHGWAMRDPDAAQRRTAELQAVRRDLAVSLALAWPHSQAGTVTGVQIAAIDAELARRPDTSPAQAATPATPASRPLQGDAAAVDAPATDST
jgi:Protein of unknown function (DUF2637)